MNKQSDILATKRKKILTYAATVKESPVQVRCMILDAWGWCTGTTQKDGTGREEGGVSGWGTRVHPWQMHVDVWQNQYNIVK